MLLYMLAKNPAEQEQLCEEVLRVLPNNAVELEAKDMDQMPYMRACIKESMRVQPIITGHLRATGQNLIIEGYKIPKDVIVAQSSHVLKCLCLQFWQTKSHSDERRNG